MASTIKNTPEGVDVLTLITALISKVISSINKQLQRSFMVLLNNYIGSVELNESRIVANLLLGYVRISLTNGSALFLKFCKNFLFKKKFFSLHFRSYANFSSFLGLSKPICQYRTSYAWFFNFFN